MASRTGDSPPGESRAGDSRAGNVRVAGKALGELTDEELDRELAQRRQRRGAVVSAQPGASSDTLRNRRVRQWYANLELKPGASLEEVHAQYRELLRRYNPDRHLKDPTKHAAATELVRELTRAYEALVAHLESKR